MRNFSEEEFGRIFCGAQRRKKPGFPLQVLGFAYANPVGFPLQSRLHGRAIILQSKIMTSPLRGPGANR
jgi:hypothetical protein